MSAVQAPKQAQQPKGKSVEANQTLFVSNLNTKIRKDDLRRALYCLCSTYGPVLDIVALKTEKMKGQAHVVFRDVQASSQAMRGLQGFEFFGREMRLSYAKGRSNIISRLDGSAKVPESSKPAPPAAAVPVMSEAQKTVFQTPQTALPNKPPATTGDTGEPHGQKRPRDEADEDSDAPMDEDSGGSAMEESDDE